MKLAHLRPLRRLDTRRIVAHELERNYWITDTGMLIPVEWVPRYRRGSWKAIRKRHKAYQLHYRRLRKEHDL